MIQLKNSLQIKDMKEAGRITGEASYLTWCYQAEPHYGCFELNKL